MIPHDPEERLAFVCHHFRVLVGAEDNAIALQFSRATIEGYTSAKYPSSSF
jgi:hypothetical protein